MKKPILASLCILGCLGFSGIALEQNDSGKQEILFTSGRFEIAGDLYLAPVQGRQPAAIFVHGDGPARRPLGRLTRKIINVFLTSGFACLFYDKPGYGSSKGDLDRSRLFEERTSILPDAVAHLRENPKIDPEKIGFWGISQAGYVMPLALKQSPDVAFMIAVSCPAMDSIDQSAYLVENQMLCSGANKQEAEKGRKFYIQRAKARTYREYRQAAEYLDQVSVIRSIGWGGVRPEKDFSPMPPDSQWLFDPITMIAKVRIPVLAIFGEKDTQTDPFQGAEAYERALRAARNPFFMVKLFPGADHGLIAAETGCMEERRRRYLAENPINFVSGYLKLLEKWLTLLKGRWDSKILHESR